MANTANNNSFPQSLDLDTWLRLLLTSSNEFYRQIALEEMLTNGFNPDFTQELIKLSKSDPSKDCRAKAEWLLKLANSRTTIKTFIKKLDVTPVFIEGQVARGELATITLINQLLRKAPQPQTIELWRETLSKEREPRLVETGLNILNKFGNAADANLAVKYLQHPDPQVVCAALSLLSSQDTSLFKKYIKLGLSSKSAVVLLNSIHLLRTVDETETIKYLSNLIFNNNPLVRQKVLRELTLISFDKIEDIFWQYVSREDQPFLLIKAGLIIAINSKQQSPFKIYDIMSTSTGLKQHIFQLILKQSLEAIQAAGILKDKSIDAFMLEIKQYISNKRKEQGIRVAAANLKATDPGIRLSAVDQLANYVSYPQIKALLVNQLKTENNSEVKALLQSLLEELPVPKAEPLVQAEVTPEKAESKGFPDYNDFTGLNLKEQRAALNHIDSLEKYSIHKKTLLQAVNNENLKKSIILELLKKIGDFGHREDIKDFYRLTKSQDNSIVAQCIKTIGNIDLDRILPELNKFLAHDDPRIKSSAFEIFAKADKAGAVQYVGTMLKQASVPIRRIGLSLLPLLDYPSIEPLLWWMLEHENNVELQDQTGYMVAANPTKDGIVKLFEFTHEKTGELKESLAEIWKMGLVSAETVFQLSAEEIEKNCWDAYSTAKEEEKVHQEYKFNSVVGKEKDLETELNSRNVVLSENPLESVLLHLYNYKTQYIIGAVVLGIIAFGISGSDNRSHSGTIKRTNKDVVVSDTSFVSNEAMNNDTQVGGKNWKEAINSGARNIIRGAQYRGVLANVDKEIDSYRQEMKQKEKDYFTTIANDPGQSIENREWAQANLDDNFKKAEEYYSKENFKDAKNYYERVANDPNMNRYGRMTAIQHLIEFAGADNNKEEWFNWMEKMLAEMAKDPENSFSALTSQYKPEAMIGAMKDMQKMSELIKSDPSMADKLKESYRRNTTFKEEDIDKNIEMLYNLKMPYEGQH